MQLRTKLEYLRPDAGSTDRYEGYKFFPHLSVCDELTTGDRILVMRTDRHIQ
jgi:hypothetical protein